MESPYSKKLSFGKLFQYDENIVTISKSNTPAIKKEKPLISKEKINQPMTELDKEINDNPFFFF